MSSNHVITYQNIPIHSVNDLLRQIPKEIQNFRLEQPTPENKAANNEGKNPETLKVNIKGAEEAISIINQMLRYETILYQGMISPLQRKYSFAKMIQVQDYLESLYFLETIKYSDNIVNARQLLHKYLYSYYDLCACNLITPDSATKKRNHIPQNASIEYGTNLLSFIEEKNQVSPSKSIRKYFADYLLAHSDESPNEPLHYNLFSALPNSNKEVLTDSEPNTKQRFYIPAFQAPEFLLLFTFFDGRNFNHISSQKDPTKLPPRKELNSFSAFSYKIVLETIQKLYPKTFTYLPLLMSTLYRCDNIFLFCKQNILSRYYNLYSSDTILNAIIQKYKITYKEALKLKDIIFHNIFQDKEFIITGLKSKYLDFMLPFDIFFQYSLWGSRAYSVEERTLDFFIEEITQFKKYTKILINAESHITDYKKVFTFTKGEELSISKSENEICNAMKNNEFYKAYYLSFNNTFKNITSDDINTALFPINFSIIKEALDIA